MFIETKLNRLSWPNGAKLAIMLGFNFESGEGARIRTFPNGDTHHFYVDQHEYGARVGIFRVLDVLDKHEVKGTFFVSGRTAERFPEAAKEITRRDHDVGCFAYDYEKLWAMDKEAETSVIMKSVEAVKEATGVTPKGWRTPESRISKNTIQLLAKAGFQWDSGFCNDDVPYIMQVDGKSLVEIPLTYSTSDKTYLYLPNPRGVPSSLYNVWMDEFSVLHSEVSSAPKMLTITCHPFLIGRSGPLKMLDSFLDQIRSFDDLWFATCGEIANAAKAGEQEPIEVVR